MIRFIQRTLSKILNLFITLSYAFNKLSNQTDVLVK